MYNCVVLHNPNMSKLGRGTWAGAKKKRNKQKRREINKQTNKQKSNVPSSVLVQ